MTASTKFYLIFKKRRNNMSEKKNKTVITAEPGKQELFITREFDAPRELVFRAHTDPDIYVRWLGPRDLATTLETFEPVSGGRWRFIQKDKNGNEFGFHGVNHDVTAPERIIGTFEFEALPGGRTRVTTQSVYQSVEDRDGMVAAGMESGVVDGFERLDEILEKMK